MNLYNRILEVTYLQCLLKQVQAQVREAELQKELQELKEEVEELKGGVMKEEPEVNRKEKVSKHVTNRNVSESVWDPIRFLSLFFLEFIKLFAPN